MKKIALSIAVALANIVICHAQELTLEVVPGKLASQLTKEQKQTVTDLILTGNLNKEDFYFMRDSLPKLKNVDLKHTEVDTIPARALYDKDMNTILLPLELKYIDEDAFSTQNISNNMSVYVTGKYPRRTAYIMRDGKWDEHRNEHLKIDEDNKELIVDEYEVVFSADGKTLYDFGERYINNKFSEGLEIIESYAFQDVGFCGYYIFPSTLKEIKKHAFYHFSGTYTVGNNIRGNSFLLKTKVPPSLGEEAFVYYNNEKFMYCFLVVPEGCADTYKNADPQWNMFDGIVEGDEPLPVSNQSVFSLSFFITKNGLNWQLSGEQIIKKVEVYNTLGHLIYSLKCNNRTIEIPCIPSESILILKVYDENGEIEAIKLNNHF